MNSKELTKYIHSDGNIKRCFSGIYASDNLPQVLEVDKFIIMNTAPANHPGLHWIVIYRYDSYTLEVFDSLGCNMNFIKQNVPYKDSIVDYNDSQLQSQDSTTCGLFCLVYIFDRVCKYT